MADEPSWDEIFSSQPGVQPPASRRSVDPASVDPSGEPLSRRQLREASTHGRRGRTDDPYGRPPKKKRRLTWLWVLIAVVVVLGSGATAVYFAFQPQIKHVLGQDAPTDYTGKGTGKVVITIANGQIGSDVAATLSKAGVTASTDAFYKLLLKQKTPVNFQPGSYSLKSHMSAQAALTALQDPKNKVFTRVSLPEGITVKGIIAKLGALSDSTGVSTAQLEAAAADYTSYGLPPEAPSLEGYLFPATYSIDPGLTAHQIFQMMVNEMFKRLDADGVPVADRHRVLTLAALTQKEGGSTADFLKVARVWDNRIAKGMNLQSDATVAYGAGSTSIETTPAQRADKSNKYNTYANPGLPIGPISNPGDAAIKATLNPAQGTWLYFVVVNCSTGETAFSDTLAQQNAANAQLGAWLKAHPGGCD
ncbi:MAG: mltG [Microbacteriaceae bacterium]|nr:mltG [Microbacteriaceae bacterium]